MSFAQDIMPFVHPEVSNAIFAKSQDVTEIRLSKLKKIITVHKGESTFLKSQDGKDIVATENIFSYTVNRLCGGSIYSINETLKKGYTTINGGHRVGICGTAIIENGSVCAVRDISDICFRICREIKGVSKDIYKDIFEGDRVLSSLIASPPAYGKTTILRDLCRLIAGEGQEYHTKFVGVADERCEIAAMNGGVSRFDLGQTSFVCTGYPKADAILLMLRTMTPDVIITDEIGSSEDYFAVSEASKCGVSIIAGVHAYDLDDLHARFGENLKYFDAIFFINNKTQGHRLYRRCNNDY